MIGKKVQVYFNLHKKCFSVRDKKTRLVIAHVNKICLEDVVFKVSEKGRQRVLKERQKNVHAFIEGIVTKCNTSEVYNDNAMYNPYKYDSFMKVQENKPLRTCEKILMKTINKKPKTFIK